MSAKKYKKVSETCQTREGQREVSFDDRSVRDSSERDWATS